MKNRGRQTISNLGRPHQSECHAGGLRDVAVSEKKAGDHSCHLDAESD